MKLLLAAAAGLVAYGMAVVDWSPGERVPLPLAVARARVARTAFTEGIVRDTASAPQLTSDAAGERVRWTFSWRPGRPASWCESLLRADGAAATRTKLTCGVADNSDPLVAQRAGELLRLVVHEQVAASLENRAFDRRHMGTVLWTFAALHARDLAQHQLATEQ